MVKKVVQRLGWPVKRFYSHGASQNLYVVRALHILQRRACHSPHPSFLLGPCFFCMVISVWLTFQKSTGKAAPLSSQGSFWQASVTQSGYKLSPHHLSGVSLKYNRGLE